MTTLLDVARRAGVSTTTVSHVVNRTRPVAESTRRTVLDAIEALEYVPNQQARALVRARSQQLGVAISVLRNTYFGELVHSIEKAASAAGHVLLLGDTHEDPDTEARLVAALRSRRVDGLLIAPSAGSGALLDRLADSGMPTVLVDRSPDPRFDSVCTENTQPLADLVGHLAREGHRRIAMVSGRRGLTTTDERVAGYRAGLAEHDIPLDPTLLADGGSDSATTSVAVAELLDSPHPPTAIVAANNVMLIATLRALQERGRTIPGDVALVGFDDFEWADVFSPRLTTVAQDCAAIGTLAVELLLERVAGNSPEPRAVQVPATIRHRDSCGCGHPGVALEPVALESVAREAVAREPTPD